MNKIAKKNTNGFTPEWRDKYNEVRFALTTNNNKKYNNIIIDVMIAPNATYNKKELNITLNSLNDKTTLQ